MERNLWDESKEASEFIEYVVEHIDDYKLFPEEHFKNIRKGILSSSEVDTQGEAITREGLQNIINQINNGIRWMGAKHNPKIQTIARIISAKLFYASKSKIYFIGAVIGYYDPAEMPNFREFGIDFNKLEFKDISKFKNIESTISAKIEFNKHEISPTTIEGILSQAPDFVDKRPSRSIRKAADPIMILTIVFSIKLVLGPFLKEYFGALGRKAADETIEFFKWIKDAVLKEIFNISEKQIFVVFNCQYEDCRIEFVLEKKDHTASDDAIDSLPNAVLSALALIDVTQSYVMKKLVLEYNTNLKRWIPLHAVTEQGGIIAEQPVSIDPEVYKGLSIGGIEYEKDENSEGS